MFGKGALITVFGFILAFSTYQVKLNRAVLSTSDNFNKNYMETLLHESAVTSMNLAINKVWDQDINSDTFTVVTNNCTTQVNVYPVGLDTVKIKVKSEAHMFDEEYQHSTGQRLLVSDSIAAFFSYNIPVSRYFWFTNTEGNVYWITKDTVWGPIHTNNVLKTSGSPTFYGKVTARNGINPNPTSPSSQANFYGGWEVGIDNSVPTDMSPLIAAANAGNGGAPENTKCIYDEIATFDFQANGNVIRTVDGDKDTVALSTIAPTGVIYSEEDIRVKGVLNGEVTIYSEDDIWIDDDIVYADDPNTNPNSDDVLGLVADDKILVTDNAANNNDVNIQACLMAINGKFTAQNYWSRPVSGVLRITGSIVQNQRGPVGTFSWWTQSIVSGFSKRYRYDPRLQGLSPPYYPYVRILHLVSWWE